MAEANKCTKIIIISIDSKSSETNDIDGSFLWWADKLEYSYNYYNKKYNFNGTGPKKYQAEVSMNTKDILIVNYESLFKRLEDKKKSIELKDNILDFIKSCRKNNVAILVDESHKIKNLDSKQTKAIYRMKNLLSTYANQTFIYLLTGTPFTVNYVDLYSQLKILGCPMNKTQFLDNFCIKAHYPSLPEWKQPVKSFKNLDQLFDLVHEYAITIKSEEVFDNLPEKIFVYHNLPQTTEMKLFVNKELKPDIINQEFSKRGINEYLEPTERNGRVMNPFYKNIDYPSFNWIADTPATFWLRARQLSIGFQGNEEECKWYDKSRLEEIKRLLEQNEENYIIFYNYTPEFVELYDICETLGYKIDIYNSMFKSEMYYKEYCNLSEEKKLTDKKRVILANFASGSTGKNWQKYHNCILASIPIFDDWQQGLKRIHRTGQKFDCIYHIFNQKNVLDDSMIKSLEEQQEYDEKMFQKVLEENEDED